MTIAAVKGKLHEYIENVDEKKLQTLYALVENDIEDRSGLYDEVALASFRSASEDFRSGKIQGIPMEQSIDFLKRKIAEK